MSYILYIYIYTSNTTQYYITNQTFNAQVIGTSSNPQIAEFVRKWSMDEVGDVSRDVSVTLGTDGEDSKTSDVPSVFVGRGQVFWWVK